MAGEYPPGPPLGSPPSKRRQESDWPLPTSDLLEEYQTKLYEFQAQLQQLKEENEKITAALNMPKNIAQRMMFSYETEIKQLKANLDAMGITTLQNEIAMLRGQVNDLANTLHNKERDLGLCRAERERNEQSWQVTLSDAQGGVSRWAENYQL